MWKLMRREAKKINKSINKKTNSQIGIGKLTLLVMVNRWIWIFNNEFIIKIARTLNACNHSTETFKMDFNKSTCIRRRIYWCNFEWISNCWNVKPENIYSIVKPDRGSIVAFRKYVFVWSCLPSKLKMAL